MDEILTIAIRDLSKKAPKYAAETNDLDGAQIGKKLNRLEQIVKRSRGSVVTETYTDAVIHLIAEGRELINARNDYVHGVLRFDEQERTFRFSRAWYNSASDIADLPSLNARTREWMDTFVRYFFWWP